MGQFFPLQPLTEVMLDAPGGPAQGGDGTADLGMGPQGDRTVGW